MTFPAVHILHEELLTPFGLGMGAAWDSLLSGKTAIRECRRFPVADFHASCAACVALDPVLGESFLETMLSPLVLELRSWNCDFLILATTKGEIDLLEHEESASEAGQADLRLSTLLAKVQQGLGIANGMVISAACASSTIAMMRGAEMLLAGRAGRVLVLGMDIVSRFVFSGFDALQALSPSIARPFDAKRDGLSLGEGIGAVCLGLKPEKKTGSRGVLLGWAAASDANHITGPSRDGSGLAEAVRSALFNSGRKASDIVAVCAHGTGTVYNDRMEIMAFRRVFGEDANLALSSIKGAIGHTMGAAGIIESILGLHSLREGILFPTIGLETPEPCAEGWVSDSPQALPPGLLLKTNSGFGGINAALLLAIGDGG